MRVALVAVCLLAAPALAGSSNSLLDVSPDGTRLLVANTDSGTVTVVDLASRKAVAEVAALMRVSRWVTRYATMLPVTRSPSRPPRTRVCISPSIIPIT